MRAAHWLLAALAAASVHCGGDDPPTIDGDRDGVSAAEDCNDADPTVWRRVAAHADGDRDGRGRAATDTICASDALPAGWTDDGSDCDDGDAARWTTGEAYPDSDGDGRAGGALAPVCRGDALPPGWADAANDCEPSDPTRWTEQPYLYRDADGDGVTAPAVGVVCSGEMLPQGYLNDPNGLDCDDADAAFFAPTSAFVDADRDQHGGEPGTVCAGYVLPAGWAAVGGDCDDADYAVFAQTSAFIDADRDQRGGEPGTVCAGGALPAGWVATGGDCDDADPQRWQWLTYYYVDRDRDGYTESQYGSACSGSGLASPYSTSPGWRGNGDCDDADPLAYQSVYGYSDTDTDGVGGGSVLALCTRGSLPAGYLATGGDCEPDDKTRWRQYSYTYRDADTDGRFVYQPGTVCYGTAVPPGYATSASSPLDCNDSDASVHTALWGYPDDDEDGVGAGPATQYCTAGTLPADRVATGTDCDDADRSRWQLLTYGGLDEDGDGFTTRAGGKLCSGAALPDPYRAIVVGNDCDDADNALWRWTVIYPDADGDGIGAPPREIRCLGEPLPAGYSLQGWDASPADPAAQAAADAPLDGGL